VATDFQMALTLASAHEGVSELYVIGGSQIYE
jgi:hypothetical protein